MQSNGAVVVATEVSRRFGDGDTMNVGGVLLGHNGNGAASPLLHDTTSLLARLIADR